MRRKLLYKAKSSVFLLLLALCSMQYTVYAAAAQNAFVEPDSTIQFAAEETNLSAGEANAEGTVEETAVGEVVEEYTESEAADEEGEAVWEDDEDGWIEDDEEDWEDDEETESAADGVEWLDDEEWNAEENANNESIETVEMENIEIENAAVQSVVAPAASETYSAKAAQEKNKSSKQDAAYKTGVGLGTDIYLIICAAAGLLALFLLVRKEHNRWV